MVNEVRACLPKPVPFNWEREYGPLWTGSDCTAFWLAPGPDDILTIDGIRAPLRDHESGAAKRECNKRANCRYPQHCHGDIRGLCIQYGCQYDMSREARKGNMAAREMQQAQLQNQYGPQAQLQNQYAQHLYNEMQQNLNPLALMGIGLPFRKGTRQ